MYVPPVQVKTEESLGHYTHLENITDADNQNPGNSALPYLLLVAICMDGLLEGIAIGVQSGWHLILFVTICVVLNKWNIALGLGIALKKAGTDSQTFIRLIVLFSMFTPLGVLIGFIVSYFSELAQSLCLATSAGSFIYASTSVVIVEEFTVTKYKYSKYLCFLLGGCLAAGIAFYEFNRERIISRY